MMMVKGQECPLLRALCEVAALQKGSNSAKIFGACSAVFTVTYDRSLHLSSSYSIVTLLPLDSLRVSEPCSLNIS